jgi:predicted O-methyltransferase YrrM
MSRRPGRIAMEVAPQTKVVILEKKAENVKQEDITTPIDLLFLDGDHTYEGTKAAFERFVPWMRGGGLIVLHDVTVRKTGGKGKTYGVWKFWDEIQYPKFLLVTERPGIGFVRIP